MKRRSPPGTTSPSIGDVHIGSNPLLQGVFAHRHANPVELLAGIAAAVGPRLPFIMPPWSPTMGVEARGMPLTPDDTVHLAAMPETRAPNGRRTWMPHELSVDGTDLVDAYGELRVSLLDAFWLPIFVAGVRSFTLLPEEDHVPRVTVGRMVIRREGWSIPAAAIPERGEDVAAFARDRGMPRRVFTKSPLERKPMFLDTESPALSRILCRQARHARADAGRPDGVHRDAAGAGPVLARRRRRRALRRGAPHGCGRRRTSATT